jgi:hypothetical protein
MLHRSEKGYLPELSYDQAMQNLVKAMRADLGEKPLTGLIVSDLDLPVVPKPEPPVPGEETAPAPA